MREIAVGILLLVIGGGVLNNLPNHEAPESPAPAVRQEPIPEQDSGDYATWCDKLRQATRDLDPDASGSCDIHHA